MTDQKKPNYTFALTVMIVLMFLLGFITTMNNSMIAFCKEAFSPLDDVKLQLINTAFFGAYIFSIPIAGLLRKIGYKTSLILGVVMIGLGMALNYLGVQAGFYGFLCCMFVVALGIVLLQVALNPYVLVLGPAETAAKRLTINQTFNSLATFVAPLFVSMIIVSNGSYNVSQIQVPFLGLGIFAIVLGLIVTFLKLPVIKEEEQAGEQGKTYKTSAFKYPHVMLGALGIFTYLGVEVGIPSFFPAKFAALGLSIADQPGLQALFSALDLNPTDPTSLLSLYWGGLLVGRAFGSAVLAKFSARAALTASALLSALCLLLSFVTSGWLSLTLYIGTGLFHSIMWSCIFSLSSVDLGPNMKQASGIICTGVIGAAVLMPVMGGVQKGFGLVPALCCLFVFYAYMIWFAQKGSKIRTE